MIAKEFEDFLLAHLDNYLIPLDQLAIFIDSHKANHVVLLLYQKQVFSCSSFDQR